MHPHYESRYREFNVDKIILEIILEKQKLWLKYDGWAANAWI